MKEPSVILFCRGAVCDLTYNNEGIFSAFQMCLLFDLPSQDNLDTFRKIKLLAAPPGLYDIEFDDDLSKEQNIAQVFREAKVGFAPVRTCSIGRNKQGKRR